MPAGAQHAGALLNEQVRVVKVLDHLGGVHEVNRRGRQWDALAQIALVELVAQSRGLVELIARVVNADVTYPLLARRSGEVPGEMVQEGTVSAAHVANP